MQDVNNDMDHLFRKAAEHYPLQTGGADWAKVLAGLQSDDAAPAATSVKQKRNRRAWWLLWLLPLCLLYAPLHDNYYSTHNGRNTTPTAPQNKAAVANKNIEEKATQPAPILLDKIIPDTNNNGSHNRVANSQRSVQSFDANGNKILTGTSAVLLNKINSRRGPAAIAVIHQTKQQPATNTTGETGAGKENNNTALNKNNNSEKQPDGSPARIETVTAAEATIPMNGQNEAITKDTVGVNKPDSALAKITTRNDAKKKAAKAQTQQQKGFYGGMAGSFDLSTVKLQRINKTGYGLQIIAGYRFSKHLSVETGLGWELKNYYSTGKYFDKKKAKIPDAVEIYFSNGNCKMLEIPLSVKYDFAEHKKSNFFVTGGLSSYFMKKEDYSYHGNYNMMRVFDTTRNYRNSGSNLLSVASFSLGYQVQLNKHSTLRIEPYIKLPLHGIGIANMPITSTGISVGFTRKL